MLTSDLIPSKTILQSGKPIYLDDKCELIEKTYYTSGIDGTGAVYNIQFYRRNGKYLFIVECV